MPAGLYVHVPFCISKCPYCDFFSVVAPDRIPQVLDDLEVEAGLTPAGLAPFDSIYIGGGTPSGLPAEQLERLLRLLKGLVSHTGKPGDVEFTVECNPADVDGARLDAMAQTGVNRISLGVQSFDDSALTWLGRRHDRTTAEAAIDRIQTAGFASLGLDLIYGLPDPIGASFHQSLERAMEIGPDHLSCYALTVSGRTPLGARVAAGEVALPAPDAIADTFLACSQTLRQAGYEHYEVSNYARGPQARARHNQKYWTREPVLGLGPAAHSFDGRSRWVNWADLDEYHQALGAGLRPVEGLEELTPEQERLERLSLGLRTAAGVSVEAVGPGHQAEIDRAVGEGLLELRAGHLRPSPPGMLVADGLARLFA